MSQMSVIEQPPTNFEENPGLDSSEIVEEGLFTIPSCLVDQTVWYCFVVDESGDTVDKIPAAPTPDPTYIDGFDPDDEHLVDFATAFSAVRQSQQLYGDRGLSGIMLSLGSCDVGIIDIDDCIDEDGQLSELAATVVDGLSNTMWEVSPSGSGLHGYVRDTQGLDEDYVKKQNDALEIYQDRGVTFTGRKVVGTSASIVECDGLLRSYQRLYNDKRSESSSGSQSGSTSSRSSTNNGQMGTAQEAGLGTEEFRQALRAEKSDLSDRQIEVIEAMCRYDDDAWELWHEGHSASSASRDKSKNDMSLVGKLAWWGREADMFDFELDQSEIEECFLLSALGNRRKIRQRPGKVSLTAYNAIHYDG